MRKFGGYVAVGLFSGIVGIFGGRYLEKDYREEEISKLNRDFEVLMTENNFLGEENYKLRERLLDVPTTQPSEIENVAVNLSTARRTKRN